MSKNAEIFREYAKDQVIKWEEEISEEFSVFECFVELTQGALINIQVDFHEDDEEISVTVYDYVFCDKKENKDKVLEVINEINSIAFAPKMHLDNNGDIIIGIYTMCYGQFDPKSVVGSVNQLIGVADYYYNRLMRAASGKEGNEASGKVIQLFP